MKHIRGFDSYCVFTEDATVVLRAVAPCRAAENADLIIDAIHDHEIVYVARVVDMKREGKKVEILMDDIRRYRINGDGKAVEVPEGEPE